ncbi:MAG TPA: hypothetical protein DCR94_02530, partial [Firmicutes bacterium]|nr:hypothetical protein [Bacillota bacterium]
LYIRKDAFSFSSSKGEIYKTIKENDTNVVVEVAKQEVKIEVDEDFIDDTIRLDIDLDKCVFFVDGKNIKK